MITEKINIKEPTEYGYSKNYYTRKSFTTQEELDALLANTKFQPGDFLTFDRNTTIPGYSAIYLVTEIRTQVGMYPLFARYSPVEYMRIKLLGYDNDKIKRETYIRWDNDTLFRKLSADEYAKWIANDNVQTQLQEWGYLSRQE